MDFNIEVNNKVIAAKKGDTILQTLKKNGIEVPTICSMKEFSPTGACRMCVVEIEGKDKLIPSCSHPVEEWMKIKTHSPRVLKARKTIIELLLANHPDDCLYCERNGTCELQNLAEVFHIRERKLSARKNNTKIDKSSPSIIHDPAKCILCGRCVRICEERQSVATLDFANRGNRTKITTSFSKPLNFSNCINCGQCILNCPTGALIENVDFSLLENILSGRQKKVIAVYSPAVAVSLAEEFGLKPGKNINGHINAALRKIGFSAVFQNSLGADQYILEQFAILKQRLKSGKNLPLLNSCCPSWVKYIEQYEEELIPNLSTCKSPQQFMGISLKQYLEQTEDLKESDVYVVSITPCIAKKFEVHRIEEQQGIDQAITTRELARLIKMNGIDLLSIEQENNDAPFELITGASNLLAVSGGTTEALMRVMYPQMFKTEFTDHIRSVKDIKEIKVKINDKEYAIIIINGLEKIKEHIKKIKKRKDVIWVEVMVCQGGCVNGGGQPFRKDEDQIKLRTKAIYESDEKCYIASPQKNQTFENMGSKFFDKPLSKKNKELYHTTFSKKHVLL